MSQLLLEGAEVETPDTRSDGILAVALPAPSGWMQGLSLPFYGCGEPVLMNRCVTADDTTPPNVLAVGTLEQAAADAGFGSQWWLHAPIKAASFLANARLLIGKRSPSGAPWVVSVGYPVQGATTVRLWVTGPVWAATDEAFVFDDLDRRSNTDEAFANRSAIVAFDPCVNLYIDVTVPASPTP